MCERKESSLHWCIANRTVSFFLFFLYHPKLILNRNVYKEHELDSHNEKKSLEDFLHFRYLPCIQIVTWIKEKSKKIVSMNLSKSECIWYINDIGHHMHSLLYSSMSTQLIIGVEAGCKPAGLVGCSLKNIKTKRKKKKRLSVFKSYM